MLTGPSSSVLTQRLERCRHYIGWARWRLGLLTPPWAVTAEDHVVCLEKELRAAKGTAADAQRKVLAQGKELHDLQAAHMRLRKNHATVQSDRDMLRALLQQVAPGVYNAWLLTQQITRATDIPQTHETHGD